VRPGSRFRPLDRLSGLAEVEGGATSGPEVDGHRLGVVRVDVQAGRGQHGVEADRAAEGLAQAATAIHPVGVELEGGAVLLALQHIFNHAVGEGGVFVGHVDGGGARAVAKAADVAAEGHVLAGGLTDRGDVDLGAADFEAPVADLAHHSEVCVIDLEFVRGSCSAVVGDRQNGTARTGGDGQRTSGSGVAEHVIRGGVRDGGRQRAGAGAAGLAVNDAEFHRIADLEVQVGFDRDDVGASVDASFTERSGGASGLVVESAGRAGQNGGGHRGVPKGGVSGRALPGLLQVSACNKHYLGQHSCHVGGVDAPHEMRGIFSGGKCWAVDLSNAEKDAAGCFSGVV
jgi:hypothetical protein